MTSSYPWLEPQLTSLAAVMAQGRFPHALLVNGLPGMGKAELAEGLASMLLCESLSEDHTPCGSCPGCIQYQAGSHADYYHVHLEVDEKTGKVATWIKIDQVRELAEKLALSSHRCGYKVAIIDPAGLMNRNAANSLLKTLEEPADNTVLVLVCEQPANLPATIRSRCQAVRIEAPDQQLARQWLEQQGITKDADQYLQLAKGAPLEALRLAQEDVITARRASFQSLQGILDGRNGPLTVAQAWNKDESLQDVRWLQEWLMDLLRINLTGQTQGVRSVDLVNDLKALAQGLSSRVMFDQLEKINRILRLSASSLNRQLMLEDILLAWAAQRQGT